MPDVSISTFYPTSFYFHRDSRDNSLRFNLKLPAKKANDTRDLPRVGWTVSRAYSLINRSLTGFSSEDRENSARSEGADFLRYGQPSFSSAKANRTSIRLT